MRRDVALKLLGISRHAYYYKPTNGRKGRPPSEFTLRQEPEGLAQASEEEVVAEILEVKRNPETDYGYRAMTAALQLKKFIINKKKVYRIMEKYQLLHEKAKKAGRTYVKHRRVDPEAPLSVIEMDIKYQWVAQHQRYAFILTLIDCFTRKVLYWDVAYSIKQGQVIHAWEHVILNYLQPYDMRSKPLTIEVRNDNDSRFAAEKVQGYLLENGLKQVFTHPYTPEENGHVESFHAILGKSLDRKRMFRTINDLEQHLAHFYATYNQVRLHGSLDYLPPDTFWPLWEQGLISSYKKNGKRKHKLKIPHYKLSGNMSQREYSALPDRAKIRPLPKDSSLTQLSV